MTEPIIDAGPALNFLAVNRLDLVFNTVGKLSTPETVAAEVARNIRRNPRFRDVPEHRWKKLTTAGWISILSDEGDELDALCARVEQQSLDLRKLQSKDLGELMVVLHAVLEAERGRHVTVLIDDGAGARLAARESHKIERARQSRHPEFGSITLINSMTILQRQANTRLIPDRAAMRRIYGKLSEFDDGLPNRIETTDLLSSRWWNPRGK